jgi:hypothetical protein
MIESKDSQDRKQWRLQSLSDLKIDKLSSPAILDTTSHWDRRRQPRYRLAGSLQVRLNIPPLERVLAAELFDVTQAGAGLQVEAPLQRGTIVTFSCGTQRIYGVVEHCRPHEGGHRIGIRISDVADE